MNNVITNGRQCGSGGHTIGTIVAEESESRFMTKRLSGRCQKGADWLRRQ